MKRHGMFAVFIFFLAAGLVFPQAPARGDEDRGTVSVLTYNIWGVVSAKYRDARAAEIPSAIMEIDPDVICLIEAFRPRDHKALREGLEGLGYPIRTWHHKDCGYGTGILVISRFDSEDVSYQKFKAEGEAYSYEKIACRGLLRMVLKTPEGPLEFFATHAIPRMKLIFDEEGGLIDGDPKELPRYLQMYELAVMMQARRDAASRSLIAVGDFNVSPEMREYELLMRLSGLKNSFDVLHPGENPSTYCLRTNEFATIEGSRIDHIMYQNYDGDKGFHLKPVEARRVMTERHSTEKGEMHLSDHYGMYTVFEIAGPEEVTTARPPVFDMPVKDREFYMAGMDDDGIEFSPDDREAWDALGLSVLRHFDRKLKQPTLAVKAAAKILTAGEQGGAGRVCLDEREARSLERFLDGMD